MDAASVGAFTLLGYTLDAPFERGATLALDTHWRVDSRPTQDAVLFVHVYGPDGTLVAQADSPPEQGRRSTLTYRLGDGIDLRHRFTLPNHAAGGEYTVFAGVYNRADQVRWDAWQNGEAAKDNLVKLVAFTLPALIRLEPVQFLPVVSHSQPATTVPPVPVSPYPLP